MNQAVQGWVLAGVLIFVLCRGVSPGKQGLRLASEKPAQLPFAISIVPTSSAGEPYGRAISTAKKSPDPFCGPNEHLWGIPSGFRDVE